MIAPKRLQHRTVLTVNAIVHYDILQETPDFPVQVDISKIIVEVGKFKRQTNILGHFDESTILAIEDEISDNLSL